MQIKKIIDYFREMMRGSAAKSHSMRSVHEAVSFGHLYNSTEMQLIR